ncbi:MAG TPA: hypothetical protein ENG51_08540 [Deltaproteobacteria bacterium]|nr:hypothetical protein [Deltaproteobacteria bacterium]HEC32241.1 hypothetical protein [Deltaproteobacteria bacterium]
MVLKVCMNCPFHEITQNVDNQSVSFCGKENCYSVYSRCIGQKALEDFLRKNGVPMGLRRSALDLCYSSEI